MRPAIRSASVLAVFLAAWAPVDSQTIRPAALPRVTRPPESFFELHAEALQAGKWRGTSAMNDRADYCVGGVLAYFDAAGHHQAPLDTSHPIRTREALQLYDPGLFRLVEETMAYKRKPDWRLGRRPLGPTAPLRP